MNFVDILPNINASGYLIGLVEEKKLISINFDNNI